MASIKNYVNGVGGSTGAELATISPLMSSGTIYYLGNATSGASDSNSGTERTKPLATIGQAYTNAAADLAQPCIIDVLAGHNEIVSSSVTLNTVGLSIIGEGAGSTTPCFTMANNTSVFTISAAGTMLDNLKFPVATGNGSNIVVSAKAFLNNLTHLTGAFGTAAIAINTGASGTSITNTTITKSEDGTSQIAIYVGPFTFTDIVVDNLIIDAGSFTWGTYSWSNGGGILQRLRATNVQLLNGSDVALYTGTTGYFHVSERSGSSVVDWTV